jgi:hypothetical protein
MIQTQSEPTEGTSPEGKKVDYLAEFGSAFVKSWQSTENYKIWSAGLKEREFPDYAKYMLFI